MAHLFDKFLFWVNKVIRRIDRYRRLRITRTDMNERKVNPRARIAIRGLNRSGPGNLNKPLGGESATVDALRGR